MAPKTIKAALAEVLEDLTEDNFHRFCHQLLDRREEPRVRRNKVEGKRRWEIADVLVSTFTEAKSVGVAVEILEEMGCGDEAQELAKYNTEAGGPKAAAGASNTSSQDKHFVDKHRLELTNRVSNVGAILDELLDADVIQQEQYDEIHALPTSQAKMRALYSGPLRAAKASSSQDKHFVDKSSFELTNRVSNVGSILDELLDADVIQEQYDKIRALPTRQAKMRALYSGPLRAAKGCKDAFYQSLEKNENLMEEL